MIDTAGADASPVRKPSVEKSKSLAGELKVLAHIKNPVTPEQPASPPKTSSPVDTTLRVNLDSTDKANWPAWLSPAVDALKELSANEIWLCLIEEWLHIDKALGYPGGVHTNFSHVLMAYSCTCSPGQIGSQVRDGLPSLGCGSNQVVISTSNRTLLTTWSHM